MALGTAKGHAIKKQEFRLHHSHLIVQALALCGLARTAERRRRLWPPCGAPIPTLPAAAPFWSRTVIPLWLKNVQCSSLPTRNSIAKALGPAPL
jgi:hypothetical protein